MSVQAMRRHRPAKPHVMTCLCGKWYSPTREDARRLRRDVEEHKGRTNLVRFYECDHGGHHWTSHV